MRRVNKCAICGEPGARPRAGTHTSCYSWVYRANNLSPAVFEDYVEWWRRREMVTNERLKRYQH